MDDDSRDNTTDSVHRVPFRFGDCGESYYGNEEDSASSEDELDIILHGTPEQKRKLSRSLSRGSLQLSSSDDDFEKEMELELDTTMKNHESQFAANVERRLNSGAGTSGVQLMQSSASEAQTGTSSSSSHSAVQGSSVHQFYDDIYFDSDNEEDGNGEPSAAKAKGSNGADNKKDSTDKKHHPIPSNDDLLYDPNIDIDNQNWMDKRRAHYYPRAGSKRSQSQKSPSKETNPQDSIQPSPMQESAADDSKPGSSAVPKTDAVLNCPACMTTLCIDCQRHELYANQYRAMFVINCCIVRSEQLRYPVSKKKRRWRKKRRHDEEQREDEGEGSSASDELYNPVKCSICKTEVAVMDKNEIFHFFNVLSSAA